MNHVKPKKHLGQHFLKDLNIARKIVDALSDHKEYKEILEIGPGMGVLTDFLMISRKEQLFLLDIDHESIVYLHDKYPDMRGRIIEGDFLRIDLFQWFTQEFAIIGNFPYNISSQIFFKVLQHKDQVVEIVCMLQKEVAQRIASGPGNKQYGILSVLLQAYYDIEYLFTVEPGVFKPPPKVKSAVLRLKRNDKQSLDCDEIVFKKIVKLAFQKRRKTLRNALKAFNLPEEVKDLTLLDKRAEQLSVEDFVELTKKVEESWKQ